MTESARIIAGALTGRTRSSLGLILPGLLEIRPGLTPLAAAEDSACYECMHFNHLPQLVRV